MHGPVSKLAALAICFGIALSTGCSMFNKKPTPEQLLNIKTPDDRLKELRELAKAAKKKTPDEQQRIVADLCKQIQTESEPQMRRQIFRTLAAYPQKEAGSAIIVGLTDGDMETRRVACTSLGKHGGKEAVGELTRVATSDTNPDVRMAAVRALGLLQPGQYTKTPVKTEFGWHVILVEDRRVKPPPTFEEAREEVSRALARDIVTAKVKELRAEAKIEAFGLDGKPLPTAK